MRQFYSFVFSFAQKGLLLLVLGLLSFAPNDARAEITLTFGTYAADKPTETVRKYRPFLTFLADRMTERLGEKVTIKMTIAKEYAEGVRQLAEGEVDFARFGPASYVMVKDLNPQIRIVAIESKKGKKRFNGVIVVHRDSPVQSLEELAGLTFAFGDELSTIGRYLAQAQLLDVGISGEDLHSFSYLGRHDLVGEAVGAGKFAAGALKESTYRKLVAKGVPIRVLLSFENVTKPWLAAADLDGEIVQAMQDIMLATQNEEIVRRVSKNGFLASEDADYDLIRDAIEQSRSF
ncbi:PhnD/SsuA/transferrin family substrate-binding protein [Pseudophaeobacter sp. EL27]|uniref:PhnD/SsuA/transferrin family substrate-binding protein n=1 Tax=Pseudophaeobacter sp. EL27 TaxID=2107580 RepID=UPI000EFA6E80|nr:PhnD/SsuA/transferrin family substrate-binding protein [Pseudophaeobacter sp. EL27]